MESRASREVRQQYVVVRRAIRKAAEIAYLEAERLALDQGASEVDAKELAWIARQATVTAMERDSAVVMDSDEGRAERIMERLKNAGVIVAEWK